MLVFYTDILMKAFDQYKIPETFPIFRFVRMKQFYNICLSETSSGYSGNFNIELKAFVRNMQGKYRYFDKILLKICNNFEVRHYFVNWN